MNEGEERTICTSHVERHNLAIRTLMQRFTRLSLGFPKKLENLEAAIAMFLAYYTSCGEPACRKTAVAIAFQQPLRPE